MEQEVTLAQMLEARDSRVYQQQRMMDTHALPVVSFTMNIAGPVKDSPAIRRAFHEGLNRLKLALTASGLELVTLEQVEQVTGCEALAVVRAPGRDIKELCVHLEDQDDLGRLFDLDVLDPEAGKWDREQLGHPPRSCLICGRPGKACASRRLHSVEELQQKTRDILTRHFAARDCKYLAGQAARALLYEVCTTPKPGLVDRANNGSHRDMDLFTFLDSTTALLPYFEQAVAIGQKMADRPAPETFPALKKAGLAAEQAMFQATGGINTHKGAIFSLGCVCAAAGRLWSPEGICRDVEQILDECAAIVKAAVDEDLARMKARPAQTTGERLYQQQGLRGIRGELADGLPAVRTVGLPALKRGLAAGLTVEQAGAAALIALMAHVTDTNLIARGGSEGRRWAAREAETLCRAQRLPTREEITALDRKMIDRDLSPGGCADLLAITYFLSFVE